MIYWSKQLINWEKGTLNQSSCFLRVFRIAPESLKITNWILISWWFSFNAFYNIQYCATHFNHIQSSWTWKGKGLFRSEAITVHFALFPFITTNHLRWLQCVSLTILNVYYFLLFWEKEKCNFSFRWDFFDFPTNSNRNFRLPFYNWHETIPAICVVLFILMALLVNNYDYFIVAHKLLYFHRNMKEEWEEKCLFANVVVTFSFSFERNTTCCTV